MTVVITAEGMRFTYLLFCSSGYFTSFKDEVNLIYVQLSFDSLM